MNALVDGLLFQVIALVVGFVLGASGAISTADIETVERSTSKTLMLNFVSLLIWVAYYATMEGTTGITLGKLITGTRVVDEHGGKPRMGQIIGRSFARLIPFEALSFLGSGPRGWHDTMSKTRVVMK